MTEHRVRWGIFGWGAIAREFRRGSADMSSSYSRAEPIYAVDELVDPSFAQEARKR